MKKPAAVDAGGLYVQKQTQELPVKQQTKEHLFMNTKNVSTKTDKAQILLQGRRMTWAELSALFALRQTQQLQTLQAK